jgi:uncharacterized protein
MIGISSTRCTAFEGVRRIASGELEHVALTAKAVVDKGTRDSVLIFDDVTSEVIEIDFRGTAQDVSTRLAATSDSGAEADPAAPTHTSPRGPGRPKLGVVAREVTLLPRHWEWLNSQPGGASVALRRLVEHARRDYAGKDRHRQAQEAAYRFMSAMAGDLPDFEEATRAFFRGDRPGFEKRIARWPADVRDHAKKLALAAFGDQK